MGSSRESSDVLLFMKEGTTICRQRGVSQVFADPSAFHDYCLSHCALDNKKERREIGDTHWPFRSIASGTCFNMERR